MKLKKHLAFAACAALLGSVAASSHAEDVYAGIGFPGLVLGYSAPLILQGQQSDFALRAEYAGGVTLSRTITRDGTDYTASWKANRVGGFVDWFPLSGTFRISGGLTLNDTKGTLTGTGGVNATINGKPVNLSGESFNMTLRYPTAMPYLGIGWGHERGAKKGFGFFADIGVQIGKPNVDVQSSLVGKFGITQADIDAEADSARRRANKLGVLPSAMLGMTYTF